MSTRSSKYYLNDQTDIELVNKIEHGLEIHIYTEMHDGLTYLELGCAKCYSGIKVPISDHVADMLIKKLQGVQNER